MSLSLPKFLLLGVLCLFPAMGWSNSVLEFFEIMAFFNTSATKCSELSQASKEALMANVNRSVSILSSMSSAEGDDKIVDMAKIALWVDKIYGYCQANPDKLLLESVTNLFGLGNGSSNATPAGPAMTNQQPSSGTGTQQPAAPPQPSVTDTGRKPSASPSRQQPVIVNPNGKGRASDGILIID